MPKVFYCSKCASQHSRPVGKRCQVAGESLVSDVEDAAPPSPSASGISSVSGQILLQLQQLGEKMDNMDRRVQRTEAALDQGNSQASSAVISARNLSEKNLVQGPRSDKVTESVVPSLGYLRENESLQSEVDKRLAELEKLNETATRGRLKSQRGGPGDFSVKRMVDWPQNFILTGSRKTRPTYDDLSITQWVSGFVRCIQEEKSDAAKECMLDYLGNLMEDASDFSWEAAKASHAIALTNMEADRLKWTDTEKLDRIRRAHAQRHVNVGQTSNSKALFAKKLKTSTPKNGIICRYFQEGSCKFATHHRTAGQYFRHACESCDGSHATRLCTQKLNSKN